MLRLIVFLGLGILIAPLMSGCSRNGVTAIPTVAASQTWDQLLQEAARAPETLFPMQHRMVPANYGIPVPPELSHAPINPQTTSGGAKPNPLTEKLVAIPGVSKSTSPAKSSGMKPMSAVIGSGGGMCYYDIEVATDTTTIIDYDTGLPLYSSSVTYIQSVTLLYCDDGVNPPDNNNGAGVVGCTTDDPTCAVVMTDPAPGETCPAPTGLPFMLGQSVPYGSTNPKDTVVNILYMWMDTGFGNQMIVGEILMTNQGYFAVSNGNAANFWTGMVGNFPGDFSIASSLWQDFLAHDTTGVVPPMLTTKQINDFLHMYPFGATTGSKGSGPCFTHALT